MQKDLVYALFQLTLAVALIILMDTAYANWKVKRGKPKENNAAEKIFLFLTEAGVIVGLLYGIHRLIF